MQIERDVKEIVGALMRALNGERMTRAAVEALSYEAEGELLLAANEAYIVLMMFAFDCEELGGRNALVAAERNGHLEQALTRLGAAA